jgi:cytochrome c peroxidase
LKVQEFQQFAGISPAGYGATPSLSFSLRTVRVAFIEPTEYEQEWKTPPLWGVSDSAPYWHDGRAETLKEAILLHGGEADRARAAYQQLDQEDQQSLLGFLQSLKAPSEGQLTAAR